MVLGHRRAILSVLAVDADAGSPPAPEHARCGVDRRACVVCAQRGADRFKPGGYLLSAVHPGVGIAGRGRLGLQLEPAQPFPHRKQSARLRRNLPDCDRRRRARYQKCLSGMVGRFARRRRRAAVVCARGVVLPICAGKPAAGLDRADQLPAVSVALAAIGIFRHHQIRAADAAGARTDRRPELCPCVAHISVCRNPVSFRPPEPAQNIKPGFGHGADRRGRRCDRRGTRLRFSAAAGNSRHGQCADAVRKMAVP